MLIFLKSRVTINLSFKSLIKKSRSGLNIRTAFCYVLSFVFIRHFRIVTDCSSMQNSSAIFLCGVFIIKNLTAKLTFWAEKRNAKQRFNSSPVVQVSTSNFSIFYLLNFIFRSTLKILSEACSFRLLKPCICLVFWTRKQFRLQVRTTLKERI